MAILVTKSCTQVIVRDRNLDLQRAHGEAAIVGGLVEEAIDLGGVEGGVIDEGIIIVGTVERKLRLVRLTAANSRVESTQSFLVHQ